MDEEMSVEAEWALDWLVALDQACQCNRDVGRCCGPCGVCSSGECCFGMNMVPVLPGLREPCGCPVSIDKRKGWVSPCRCQGRGWVAKRGRQDVQDAMIADGWELDIYQRGRERLVRFSNYMLQVPFLGYRYYDWVGEDADDWIAAYKALRAVGFDRRAQ